MGIKSKIKTWLSTKLKNLVNDEQLPVLLVNTRQLLVGRSSFHNGGFEIRGAAKVAIGSFCALGRDIKIITKNHNYHFASMQYGFYKKYFNELPYSSEINNEVTVTIGSDVWIGDNAIILPNVTIGHGAIIGAGSLVTKDVLDYSIVGGVPAKVLKDRFSPEVKATLLASEWWNWSEEKISQNKVFFFKNYNQ